MCRVLLRGFELYLRAIGRRPVPVDRTVRAARHYLAFCNGGEPFDRQNIMSYLAASADRVRRITLRNRWDALRSLCRYAQAEALIDEDPMAGLSRPRVSADEMQRDVDPISEELLQSILAVCPSWTWIGLRDRAILMTLWDTPLRASEICGLEKTDVNWDDLEVRVKNGKGGSRYESTLTHHTGLALQRYLRACPYESSMLFVTRDGLALRANTLAELLRKLSQRARVEPPLFPHRFRHNYRFRLRVLGMDDADISALMGHKTIESTWGYARKASRELAKGRLREKLSG